MIEHLTDNCPCDPDLIVRFDLGDGHAYVERAGDLYWGRGLGPEGEGRILRYAPLVPAIESAAQR